MAGDPPDLIIADWNLPDGKGIDILTRSGGAVTIPLIIMSGFGDERLAVEIMKSGAVDYFVKSATMFEELPSLSRRAIRFWENIQERVRAERTVQETQKRLGDILAFLPDPVLAIDKTGTVIAWNNALEELTGIHAADMIGKGDYEYSIPFYGERRPILIDLVLEDDAEILKRYPFVDRKGDRITSEVFVEVPSSGEGAYLWGTASPLYDTDGSRIGAIEVIRDVTLRKKAEQAVRSNEEKFRSLVQEVPDFILVHRNGRILFANLAVSTITGYSSDDLEGRSILDFVIPEDRNKVVESMEKRQKGEPLVPYEIRILTKMGGARQVIIRGSLIDFDGSPASLNVLTDITDIRLSETALAESEARFRELFNNMSSGVVIYEPVADGKDFIIRDINRAVEKIEIIQKEDIVGKSVLEIFPGVVEFGLFAVFQRVTETGIAEAFPVSLYKDNRISGWRDNYVYRIASGEIVSIYEDVTDKKKAEEAVRESDERFRMAVRATNDTIWDWNLKTGSLWWSEGIRTVFGYLEGEIAFTIGAWEEIIHPDDRENIVNGLNRVIGSGGEKWSAEYRLKRSDGTYADVLDRGFIIRNSANQAVRMVGAVLDLTERKAAERALAVEAAWRRILIDQSRDGIVTLDQDGKVFESNQRFADMLGYSPEEMKDLYVWDWDASKSRDELLGLISVADENGAHFETRHRRKNGSYLDVEISTNGAVFAGKKLIFCVVRDISEREAARQELEKRENWSRALIQNSSDIIRVIDRGGRIMFESDSAQRILGYSPGALIGKDPLDYVHPEDYELVKNDLQDVILKTNSGIPTEFRIRKADNEYIWVESQGSNLLDTPGVNGIVVTTRPIQQRKEAEKALRESEERLRLALEGADAGFWDWNLHTGNAVFSDRFYTMLGYEPGEFPATYEAWIDLMHPDDRNRIIPTLEKQIRSGDTMLMEIEYRCRTKERNWIWLLGKGKVVERDKNGIPLRITGVNIDITNRRLMESEIRSLNEVLEQRVKDRTDALSKANDALEEENAQRLTAEEKMRTALEEKTVLLKEIHHRVKNNLQIIASLLNLQSRYIKDEATLAAIRESQNRVKAMAMVHEKLYRAEDIAHIDLNDYIKFLGTGLFQFYDARSRGIQFRIDIQNVNVDISTAIPVGLIINELISNSLKYAFPAGKTGEVAVSITKEGQTMTVIFSDNGIGLPPELDWQNTQSLGLRLVNSLVDQLNGTIELDRSSGTRFTMVLQEKA